MNETIVTIHEARSSTLRKAKETAVQRFLLPVSAPSMFVTLALTSVEPRHNVVGVGIGRKVVRGRLTGAKCIRLYVERKAPKEVIPPSLLLPTEITGVETDVIETGRFRPLQARKPFTKHRLRPARPGCSVGFQLDDQPGFLMAGTFGAVVRDNAGLYILSNNHVLANENRLPLQSQIFQPGLLDGGSSGSDRIARLSRFVEIRRHQPNTVDCAIARVDKPNHVRAVFLPKVGRLRNGIPVEAREEMGVHKVGRTTGYTEGTVFDINADITVDYDIGPIIFQNQALIKGKQGSFSAAGDSGSVIVDQATNQPTALLFAGSSVFTVANHIAEVLLQLGVSIVE